jgi:hypothetical protein
MDPATSPSDAIHLVGGADGEQRRAVRDLVRLAGGDPGTLRLALDTARERLRAAPDEGTERCVQQLEAALTLLGAEP